MPARTSNRPVRWPRDVISARAASFRTVIIFCAKASAFAVSRAGAVMPVLPSSRSCLRGPPLEGHRVLWLSADFRTDVVAELATAGRVVCQNVGPKYLDGFCLGGRAWSVTVLSRVIFVRTGGDGRK